MMGNSVDSKFIPKELPQAEDLSFFLGLTIQWLDTMVSQLHAKTSLQLSLKQVNKLSWRSYFGVFKTLRASVTKATQAYERANFHPAIQGYHMQRAEAVAEEAEAAVSEARGLIDDDFTNDEASDASSEGEQSDISGEQGSFGPSSTIVRRHPPRQLDAQYISPIFFGYSLQRSADHASQAASAEQLATEREQRALGKAIQARSVLVDALEKKAQQQHGARQRRIEELTQAYEEARRKREEEFLRSVGQLGGDILRLVKVRRI
ncbi:hypothetical protein EON64_11540 [archaeon]|nr:MAG: hypothetical protein EON64_11540 [archaeon]